MKTHTKDYYQILGIQDKASLEEIKKAYRRLALEHHPDRNPNDPHSEERFKNITEAYGVLMDSQKRAEFDRFRESPFTGSQGGPQFSYSQQEIFENMFRQAFGRDIFNDLNTDFKQSGFRSGPDFFGAVFFGTAGGIGKFLRMIPGPIGKIGTGLWLLSSVGSSLYSFRKKAKAAQKRQSETSPPPKVSPSLADSIKNLFPKSGKKGPDPTDPNLYYQIAITPTEAQAGAKKEISYQVGDDSEHLEVRIPPGITSGKKLRIRQRGARNLSQRGDLILTVQVKS